LVLEIIVNHMFLLKSLIVFLQEKSVAVV